MEPAGMADQFPSFSLQEKRLLPFITPAKTFILRNVDISTTSTSFPHHTFLNAISAISVTISPPQLRWRGFYSSESRKRQIVTTSITTIQPRTIKIFIGFVSGDKDSKPIWRIIRSKGAKGKN